MGAVSDQMVPTCAVGAGNRDNDGLRERLPRGEIVLVVTIGLHVCRGAAVVAGDLGGRTFEGGGAIALDVASFSAALTSSP